MSIGHKIVMLIIESITAEALKLCSKDKTILDIGGYDGEMCHIGIEAGAKSAVCVDDESWKTYDNWKQFTPYKNVIYIKDNFMNYKNPADVVIFKNVIYHQRNPWATMEHIRKLTKEVLFLTTSYIEGDEPVWRVYKPFEGHPISWTVAWRPTQSGLIKLLEATGFIGMQMSIDEESKSLLIIAAPGELPKRFGERN